MPERRAPTDKDLLVAARGDADAFTRFYRLHAAAVLGFLTRRLRDPELAADVCAETFAALPASQRDAVRARVLHEQSYTEIAATHNTTEANVRQRVTRGLARLRRRMEEPLR